MTQSTWKLRGVSLLPTIVICGMIASSFSVVRAQVDYCEPSLHTDSKNPHSYRNMPKAAPDRCEGLYIQPVAGVDILRIASLVDYPLDFTPEDTNTVEIRWGAFSGNPIHLRAQTFGRLYYRMDTERAADKTFRWSTSVLNALGLRGKDLGLIGWTTMTIGDRQEKVYIPVAVDQAPQDYEPDIYQLSIEPAQELDEIYLTVAPGNVRGELGNPITDQAALQYGYYPARAATVIYIELPSVVSSLFQVQVSATLIGGGWAANEFWIYVGAD